jgi:hypothetical protein
MQSVLNRVYNKIIESDATVGAHKYQKDWILVDANRRPITNIGTEYELECRRVNSDNRLVTEIVAPGSKLTALSCVPGTTGSLLDVRLSIAQDDAALLTSNQASGG